MISTTHRFHGHSSLQYLHHRAAVVRGRGLSLKYVANTKRTNYRAAVVVSKKVHKSAVVRNRIRRRIYEVIRLRVEPTLAYDFAFMVYDEAFAVIDSEQLQKMVTGLLSKAKLTAKG